MAARLQRNENKENLSKQDIEKNKKTPWMRCTCMPAIVTNQRAFCAKGRPAQITGEALQVTVSP